MNYKDILSHFKIKQQSGNTAKAVCPAHADKQASLSITYDNKENKTLVICHAGCETRDVLDSAGLKIIDLFDKELIKIDKKNSNIEAVYKYTNENNNLVFEKVRFKGKKFANRRYQDGVMGWGLDEGTYYETYKGSNEYSMKIKEGAETKEFKEVKPILYNLTGILKAKETKDFIIVTEGEKDADNLIKLGFAATTTFDGASKSKNKQKWREEYNKYFENCNVVLIGDNDEAGRAHMEFIAKSLYHITSSIQIPEFEGLELKEDISDWIQKGHTKEELLEIIKNTEEYTDCNLDIINDFNFSDVGNAERMVAFHGDNIRCNPLQQCWFVWSGKHWEKDENCITERLAIKVIKQLQRAGENIKIRVGTDFEKFDTDLKKKVTSFVLKSENDNRIKAMLNQTINQKGIMLRNTNADTYQLNLLNGTLNLKTGELKPHDRNDNITKLVKVSYDPNAKCPNWLEFLNKIFLKDEELIEYMQRSIGYSLTGDVTQQCFYMLYGNGANGKSTMVNAIERLIGDYMDTLAPSSLAVRKMETGARNDLAKLQNARLVVSSELSEGQALDEALIKAMTAGDKIPVRFLYGEEFELKPQFKLWIMTNHKPYIKGSDHGIWRRVRLIPFLYKFTEEEKIEDFFERFIAPEMSGILNWAIEGCLKWQEEGITVPQKVLMSINEYQNEMDQIGRFIDECCIVEDTAWVPGGQLYKCYEEWAEDNGEKYYSNVKFAQKLKEKGFSNDAPQKQGRKIWSGIGVATITPFDKNKIQLVDENYIKSR